MIQQDCACKALLCFRRGGERYGSKDQIKKTWKEKESFL